MQVYIVGNCCKLVAYGAVCCNLIFKNELCLNGHYSFIFCPKQITLCSLERAVIALSKKLHCIRFVQDT